MSGAVPQLTVIRGGNCEDEESRDDRIRDRAKELSIIIDSGYMELGKILYRIADAPEGKPHEQTLWQRWGFKRWDDYVEQELSMGVRKANRLKAVYFKLEVDLVGISEATKNRFIGLGFTKVRELIRVVDGRTILDWIVKAERGTADQVYNMVQQFIDEKEAYERRQAEAAFVEVGDDHERSVRAPADAFDQLAKEEEEGADVSAKEAPPEIPDPEIITYKRFALFDEQAKVMDRALRRAGAASGSHKESEQLTLLCEEYLANSETVRGMKAKVETLHRLARIMGVRLVIVDPRTMNVVHGMDTLTDLAERAAADSVES